MYLSIDFEDFHHDAKRSFGIWETGPLKTKSLWEKYEKINTFLKQNFQGHGRFATFFCTGVIAEKEPSLIRQIARDGHEIGCHYFYHDLLKNDDDECIYNMLSKAKEYLENASETEVIGFRAPVFAINYDSPTQYKAIEKVFEYDSSFKTGSLDDVAYFKEKMGLKKLKIFPIYSKNVLGKSLRLGGTYLKMFPEIYSKLMIKSSKKNGIEPHIYLHPYEFDISTDMKINFMDLKKLGNKKAIYWYIRQNQWLAFNNKSTIKKLTSLIKENPLKGTLKHNINNLGSYISE